MKPTLLRASALCLSLAAPNAAAQGGEAVSEEEEIKVVGKVLYSDQVAALKTPTLIIDVPQSLSILTADDIIQRGFTSVGEIINYTPGVNNSQGEGHRDAIVFRGVRSTADFYIDGMRDDVQYYRPLYNLEQVEILRGPNALLFGRGGTGGILNRVTKKGEIGETFIGYLAGVDTFGEYGVQFDMNMDTGERSAVRINAMYESLNNHRDFYDGERFGINPTARFKLSSSTVVDVSYEYVDHERFVDRGIPVGADGRPVEALQDVVFADPDQNFTELKAHLLRANIQHQFSDNIKGNFSAFYGDYDKVYVNLFNTGYDPATNRIELDGYIDDTQRQNLILSGNLFSEFETGSIAHGIIAGVEYINTSSDQFRFNSFFDTSGDDAANGVVDPFFGPARSDQAIFNATRPISFRNNVGTLADGRTVTNDYSVNLNDDTRVSIDVFSAFLQDEVKVTDWLNIVVGLRFDSFDISVNNLGDPDNPDLRSRKDEEISPRAGLIFKPMENISLYASFSESFLPRSGEQFANINGDNDALEPDTFRNLEAGVKWDVMPGLSFTAAIFQIQQRSPQVADDDPATLDVIESEIQGFEAQLQGQVTEWWFVSAGYSYLDGNQVDATGTEGNRVRELPKHMVSMWNTFQVNEKLGLGLGVTHQSSSFADNSNFSIMPSFTRVDAAAFYDVTDDLRLQVNIENLTDTLYFPNSHSTHQLTVGAPINARFAISGRF
ncbi:MAG: TonB-dependent siderophore receptor [Pseudomonadota bacterium]